MPDTTVLPTGGMQQRGGGTNWLLVGAVGVGAVFLLLMMTKKGGSAGQPTTAAGASINAALGSIQEQNLNIMGEVSQGDQRLSNELGAVNSNVVLGSQGLSSQLANLASATQYSQDTLVGEILSGGNPDNPWYKEYFGPGFYGPGSGSLAESVAKMFNQAGAQSAPTPPANINLPTLPPDPQQMFSAFV